MNTQQLETFENIPASGLNNITSASINEVTDDEIFKTADIADTPITPATPTDGAKKSTVSANKNAQTTPTKLGGLVGGELATRLLDAAVPALLVTAIHFIGYELDKQKMKLNADDRKVIAPLVQDALNAIEIDFSNPFINLAFGLSIVYGAKLVEEIPNMKRRTKKAPAKIINIDTPTPVKESTPIVKHNAPPDVEFDNDFSAVTLQQKVNKRVADVAPELAFKLAFDEVIEDVRQRTGRKSRRGAISYLYQYERSIIKDLLDKYGFSEPPNDNDYRHVKERTKNVDFNL